jgi:PEP-CTERM motif
MKFKCLSLVAAVALMLAMGSVGKADSLTFGNLTADGTLTSTGGGNYTLTFSLTNSNSSAAGITDFSLELFGGGPAGVFSATSTGGTGASLSGFQFFDDTKQNNGSGDTCNTTTNDGWLCVDYSGGFGLIPGNGSLTYSFNVYDPNGTPQSPLELMAQGCYATTPNATLGQKGMAYDGSTGCVYNGAGSFNISHAMDGSTVPEPGSLMLFGTGLLGMAGFMKRKLLG